MKIITFKRYIAIPPRICAPYVQRRRAVCIYPAFASPLVAAIQLFELWLVGEEVLPHLAGDTWQRVIMLCGRLTV